MVVIDKLTSMMLFGTYKSIGIQVKLYGDVKYTVVESYNFIFHITII